MYSPPAPVGTFDWQTRKIRLDLWGIGLAASGGSPEEAIVDTPAAVLDCVGSSCPLPVVQTSQAIKEIQPGQVLLLLSDDPGVEPDMRAWSTRTGHALLGIEREGSVFQVRLRRAN